MPPADGSRPTPTTTSAMPGSRPISATTPDVMPRPTTCWPQRSRNSPDDRLRVAQGPVPSKAMTGTARNVTRAHARPPSAATMVPPTPWNRASMARRIRLTVVVTSAQPAIWGIRRRAAAMPSRTVVSSPCSDRLAHVASATEKKMPAKAARYAAMANSTMPATSSQVPAESSATRIRPGIMKAAVRATADMPPSTGKTASERSALMVRQLMPASSRPCLKRLISHSE